MSGIFDKIKGVFGYGEDEYYDDYDEVEMENYSEFNEMGNISSKKINNNVISIHNNPSAKIVIYEPMEYDEVVKMATDLKSRKSIIVNLEQLDKEIKNQIFYFLTGAVFSVEGTMQKVANDIIILTPNNVEIEGVKKELKNKGISIW